jgi:hypothetical protein
MRLREAVGTFFELAPDIGTAAEVGNRQGVVCRAIELRPSLYPLPCWPPWLLP